MKKGDKILLAVITLSAAVFLLAGTVGGVFHKTAGSIEVYTDNEKTAVYSLGADGVYEIKTAYGYNMLTVKDGKAFVSESDCPGGDCMNMKLDTKGGSIICLPHHLVIKAGDGDTEGMDGITR